MINITENSVTLSYYSLIQTFWSLTVIKEKSSIRIRTINKRCMYSNKNDNGGISLKKFNYGIFFICISLFVYSLFELVLALIIQKPFMEGLSHLDKGTISLILSAFLVNILLLIKSKEEGQEDNNKTRE